MCNAKLRFEGVDDDNDKDPDDKEEEERIMKNKERRGTHHENPGSSEKLGAEGNKRRKLVKLKQSLKLVKSVTPCSVRTGNDEPKPG